MLAFLLACVAVFVTGYWFIGKGKVIFRVEIETGKAGTGQDGREGSGEKVLSIGKE
ncbi:hypothetical protein K440DRAFT_629823 [Wilcoxina mikolae CBS 423.85]|nr:hypothetical protein K440DRAFT_629823 [Wilcoxina mikolae CBS 423.85]